MKENSVFKNFSKDDIFLLPNLLTYFRIILLPFILYFYAHKESYGIAAILIVVSFITDVLDGFIARKFNMVSNIGKAMDPIADKLTQGFIGIALCFRYKLMILFVVVFGVGHVTSLVLGIINTSVNNEVNSAKWHGKVCTGIIIASLLIIVLIPNLNINIVNGLTILMTIAALFNSVMYSIGFIKKIKK